jgi:hypothetical protein
MVSIGRVFETPNGNFMMDCIGLRFTYFASSPGTPSRLFPCGLPSTPSGVSPSTRPPGMIFLSDILGLPFCHAPVITKRHLGVKITGGTNYLLSAVVASFGHFVFRFAMLVSPLMITGKRAVDSIKTAKGLKGIPASGAHFFNGMIFIFKSWHKFNLVIKNTLSRVGIEIEEKYCEIAVRRLQQEVLPL